MANQIGSASGLEDLFGKIVSFLTSDPTLVSNGHNWTALRLRRDNIQSLTSNMADPTASGYRRMIQTCRYDARSLNTDDPASSPMLNNFYYANVTMGVSYVQWQLKTARDVRSIKLRSPLNNYYNSYMIRNFRLQYSDNGSTWSTALTVNSSPVYTSGEWKEFSFASVGEHMYWQIIIDSAQSGTRYIAWSSMLLLEVDGTVANHFGSEVLLKAPGNSGTESIYTGIRSEYDASAGWYNLFVNGYTGFDVNEQSWLNQPGALPGFGASYTYATPMIPCWDATMPYWFVASGRSFRFAVKVSTSYEGGYLGYILPYATPGQYPYPIAVGGSLTPTSGNRSAEWRYSYANWRHGVYPGPGCNQHTASEGVWATLYLRNPDGEWVYFGNRGASSPTPEAIYGPSTISTAPYTPNGAWRSVWPHCMNDQWFYGRRPYRECLGGGYILQPCIMLQRAPFASVYGELDGTYVISGYQNSPENTTTVGGKTIVVFQQAYRNSVHEFWALSMD